MQLNVPIYCIDDPDKTLKTSSKIGYGLKISRCVNDESNSNQICSSNDEIDEWL